MGGSSEKRATTLGERQKFRFSSTYGESGFFSNITVACIGFSFLNAWIALIAWSPALADAYGQDSIRYLRLLFFLGDALGALVLKYITERFTPQRLQFALVPLGTLITIPVAIPALLGNVSGASTELTIPVIVWIVAGVGTSLACASWSYFLKPSTYHCNLCNSATPFIITGAIFIPLAFMSSHTAGLVILLLPLLAAACWYTTHIQKKLHPEESLEDFVHGAYENGVKNALGLNAKEFSLFTINNGSIIGFVGCFGVTGPMAQWTFLFVGGSQLAAGLAMYLFLGSKLVYPNRIFFMIISPLAAVLLFATVASAQIAISVACLSALFALSACYHIASQMFTSKFRVSETNLAYSYFNMDRIMNNLGIFAGWLLCLLGESMWGDFSSTVLLFVAILFVLYFFITRPLITMQAPATSGNDNDDALWFFTISDICEIYQLSEREHDIFEALAKGKKKREICEELGIALNTVRTHSYRIYQKLNVHSQEELIELVNKALTSRR